MTSTVEIHVIPDSPFVACEGKARYTSVKTVAQVIARRSAAEGFELYAYRCPRCACIHITKHPPSVYLRRSQDSRWCATRAIPPTARHAPIVSAGHHTMQAAMEKAGIVNHLTAAPPARDPSAPAERS